jgi:prepilin-type N-terminal cleavage/methylation domain-containing protein
MYRSATSEGFTLLELMIVVSIITFLSLLTVPSLMKTLAKTKRTEAYLYLRTLAQAQKVYYAEHGHYTKELSGPDSVGWKPEGCCIYTYGFSGTQEGVGHFMGTSGAPVSALVGTHASRTSFKMAAAGLIYGDTPDVLTIDEQGKIVVVQDSLS